MEDLAEEAGKGVIRIIGLAVRSAVWLIWNFFFETLAWYAGWPVCRLLSFGRYPAEGFHGHESVPRLHGFVVSLIGFVLLVALGSATAHLAAGA